MKQRIIFFALLFTFCISLSAQYYKSTITGVVQDESGEPLIGVNVIIKGTTTGTTTDIDGNYSITTTYSTQTLSFSYLGFKSQDVLINGKNVINVVLKDNNDWGGGGGGWRGSQGKTVYHTYKNPHVKNHVIPKYQPDMSKIYSKKRDGKGIGILSDESPRIENVAGNVSDFRSIVKSGNDSAYHHIKYFDTKRVNSGWEIIYNSAYSFENINKLPKLQNDYSQYIDGSQRSIFSWGPAMNQLEYDGITNDYDKNGNLVALGSGNGIPGNIYDATSFFKTGIQSVNNLTIKLPVSEKAHLDFGMRQNHRESVLRGSESDIYDLSLGFNGFEIDEFTLNTSASYNFSEGRLLSHGGNQAAIIGAIYSTPISFDNTNGIKPEDVYKNNAAWLLPNGQQRSYADLADNPYARAYHNPDRDELERARISTNLRYTPHRWKIGLNGNFEVLTDSRNLGGMRTYGEPVNDFFYKRIQNKKAADAHAYAIWEYRKFTLTSRLDYAYTNDKLNADYINTMPDKHIYSRHSYEVLYGGEYFWNNFSTNFTFNNRHYFSNTAKNYDNWFPGMGINVNLQQLFTYKLDTEILRKFRNFKIIGSANRTLKESPLISGNEIAFTNLSVANYNRYFPISNLMFNNSLKPEIAFDKVLSLSMGMEKVTLDATYTNSDIDNFIAPHNRNLENVGKIKNNSWKINSNYYLTINYDWKLDFNLSWYKYTSTVKELYADSEIIPLAGFNEVQTVLTKNKPVGAIYGTDFLRNNDGKTLINADGFPLRNNNLRMIGDPTPDFMIGFNPKVSWRWFSLLLDIEYKHGGDMWNGTQAHLDYLGRSQTTAELRNTKNYVFDGIDLASGLPNTQPVDFLTNDISANRWSRYGYAGVGTEYIEDASWLRLSNVKLNFNTKIPNRYFKELDLGFAIKNLFVITKYKGVDPASTLFNYTEGRGLDLFNSPGVRTYMFTLKMKVSDKF